MEVMGSLLPVCLLMLTASPLMPLSTLLTVWILRRSAEGCGTFRLWFRQKKRLALTGPALLGTALCFSFSLLYATLPLLFQESKKFPLQIVAEWGSGGIARVNVYNAAVLLAQATGVLLLIITLILVLCMDRMARSRINQDI